MWFKYFPFHTNLVKRGTLQQAVQHIGLLPHVTTCFCYKDSQIFKRFDEKEITPPCEEPQNVRPFNA
jgi:hypothetical protein